MFGGSMKSSDYKNGTKIKILLIDDDKLHLQILKKILEDIGEIEIFEATSAKESLKFLLKNKQINMIFIDIYLPDMNGFDLCKKITKKIKNNNFKIIAITADDKITKQDCLNVGFSDLYVKPISKKTLEKVINNYGM